MRCLQHTVSAQAHDDSHADTSYQPFLYAQGVHKRVSKVSGMGSSIKIMKKVPMKYVFECFVFRLSESECLKMQLKSQYLNYLDEMV